VHVQPTGSLEPIQGADTERLPRATVALSALAEADTPRRSGESLKHIRRLAESEDELPPILVHRPTMRIIDGMHRFRAAQLRGQRDIEVRFFDGDEASSFVLGVQANIRHGLPLSLADRKAAAARVLALYPHWSDRMIASATGLAAKTVGTLRPAGDDQHLDARVGRDGRTRPVNGAERRRLAARLLAENPDASLREVARKAGISPETVRAMRAQSGRPAEPGQPADPAPPGTQALRALRGDPAFRSTESGRSLLRMLATFLIIEERGEQILGDAPAHCLIRVAEAAQACAYGWQGFAERAQQQGRSLSDVSR
jgi:ParB-like chromosome segregation protein Spo0J